MHPKELHISFDKTPIEGVSIKAELFPGSKQCTIFFRSNDIGLTKNTEVLRAVGLLPAMKIRSTLVAEGLIGQKFFHAIDSNCAFYRILNPSFKKNKNRKCYC
jgi:hypothetical protein